VERLIIAAVLVAVAVVVALVVERRRPDAPTQSRTWPVPTQLDRADFAGADVPWLVAVFSSATCRSCARAVEVARVLESSQVAVDDVEVAARKDVHDRYGIEAVPTIVVADAEGIVRASFVGPPTATDLWAAVAEVREPGSTPGECSRHFGSPS
jgi:protein-disulfide isomerase